MDVANLEDLMKAAKRKIDLFGTDNFRSWMLYFVPGDGTDMHYHASPETFLVLSGGGIVKGLKGEERPINTSTLGITFAVEPDFDSDTSIDTRLNALTDALGVIRSQSSSFGSNLSIVQNRTDFTKAMINTLQTGADSLVLADTNEEAANMLALQTRQQLSSTALSLASQADQAVLRLF